MDTLQPMRLRAHIMNFMFKHKELNYYSKVHLRQFVTSVGYKPLSIEPVICELTKQGFLHRIDVGVYSISNASLTLMNSDYKF